jgi:hypothetical protein
MGIYMSTPVKDEVSNGIKEIDAEMIEANKYNIAMTILEKDSTEGEGMLIRYQDYQDEMSRLQFADFIQGLTAVSNMMAVLNVYRPELLDKIMDTIEEPTAPDAGSGGAKPAAAAQSASEPAAVKSLSS